MNFVPCEYAVTIGDMWRQSVYTANFLHYNIHSYVQKSAILKLSHILIGPVDNLYAQCYRKYCVFTSIHHKYAFVYIFPSGFGYVYRVRGYSTSGIYMLKSCGFNMQIEWPISF